MADQEQDPVRAVKRSRILVIDGRVRFVPLNSDNGFTAELSEAECLRGRDHISPGDRCSCGWYATRTIKGLRERVGVVRQGSAELDVELSGRVVVHEKGYRAQRQAVLEARVPDSCRACGAAVTTFTTHNITVQATPEHEPVHSTAVVGVCDSHVPAGRTTWTRSDLAGELGCDVVLASGLVPRRSVFVPTVVMALMFTTLIATPALGIADLVLTGGRTARWLPSLGAAFGVACGSVPFPVAVTFGVPRATRRQARLMAMAAASLAGLFLAGWWQMTFATSIWWPGS